MAGKSTGRGKSGKDLNKSDMHDNVANFTLPDSLPCSEVEFPILIKKRMKAKWSDIMAESNQKFKEIEEYQDSKKEIVVKAPFIKTECDYIKDEVFIYLLPALEECLNKAKLWDALVKQKCFFNGIDHIVQLLWNNNPRYPNRKRENLHVFNMPWVQNYLRHSPRPYYPMSWLWSEEYAATLIQKTVRQYFVQREDDVQEMRDFWKKLKIEKQMPDMMGTNPFLAKKFASQPAFTKSSKH